MNWRDAEVGQSVDVTSQYASYDAAKYAKYIAGIRTGRRWTISKKTGKIILTRTA